MLAFRRGPGGKLQDELCSSLHQVLSRKCCAEHPFVMHTHLLYSTTTPCSAMGCPV